MTGIRVLSEQCGTCIFRPGNPMHLRPGPVKAMVAECRSQDRHIPCHEFLDRKRGDWVAGPRAQGAICRGYWDTVRPRPPLLQVAERMGLLVLVPPPPDREDVPVVMTVAQDRQVNCVSPAQLDGDAAGPRS